MKRPEKGHLLPAHGVGKALGNGHAVIDNVNFRGRPVARWIPIYGEAAKPEIERIRAELVARLGEARAARVADTNRNLVVFPNLVLNDGSSVTIRTFHPLAADHMQVRAWALGPEGGNRERRARCGSTAFSLSTAPAGSPRPTTSRRWSRCRAGLGTLPRNAVVGDDARHGEGGRAVEHRRAASARVLDAVGQADAASGHERRRRGGHPRRRSRIFSTRKRRCSTRGGSTTGSRC